jgi:hypothetical protein
MWVFQDFRDAIYYPVVAFLDGRNPYDPGYARFYPVDQAFTLYPPLLLLVFLPVGLLPFEWAEGIYYLLTLGLTVTLAYGALRGAEVQRTPARVLGFATAILLSRPGHMNLLLGQPTLPVVLGSYAAICYGRTRPWLAAAGLVAALLKPTFGVPLAVLLLLGRGDVVPVVAAGIATAVGSIVPLAILAWGAGGLGALGRSLLASWAAFGPSPGVDAASSWARLDAVALLGHALGTAPSGTVEIAVGIGILASAVVALRRLASVPSMAAGQVAAALVCLTVLVSNYHQAYDALLLALPIAALAGGTWAPPWAPGAAWRWTLLALVLVPWVNYLATWSFINTFHLHGDCWRLATAANAAALLAAFGIHLAVAARRPG